MKTAFPFQQRACDAIDRHYANGVARVLLVAPTGAGKTFMGIEQVKRTQHTALWVAHRTELVKQAVEGLEDCYDPNDLGVIAPGYEYRPHAKIQVGTVQSLLARDHGFAASFVVFDEAHHYVAEEWSELAEAYPNSRLLGLTATPSRRDKQPMGDLFDRMVIAATYSELLEIGRLVPCRVYQPPRSMTGRDLALDPVEAWQRHGEQSRTFCFVATIAEAYRVRDRFEKAGVTAEVIEKDTKPRDRAQAIERFKAGETLVLVNVYALTEGVDVPAARCVILARKAEHPGMFLQICGRVLRAHPEKQDAIIIDLSGATLIHGLPTDDRVYSLEGKGIERCEGLTPLRNCLACGITLPSVQRICPECGMEYIPPTIAPPRIHSLELREVYAGPKTPDSAKVNEYQRLRKLGQERGWKPYMVQREYKKLFGEEIKITDATEQEQYDEFTRLSLEALAKGYKPGFVWSRYLSIFGENPKPKWYQWLRRKHREKSAA